MAILLGRYELLRPIGRGGMAEVWLGRRRGAGGVEKRVVIKRILREKVRDPRFLELFVREAEISMALAHKNIVPTFDFGRVRDELFLVMEYVDGINLGMALGKAKLAGESPDATLACHIILEACQALDYAHCYKDHAGEERRIAHRDVTPGNLLLSLAGEVKLGDFGLAAATADDSEGSGRTHGTPGYMAPEQAMGGFVGPAADIFSLGVILREVLLSERLRTGSPEEQIAMAKEPVAPTPDTVPRVLAEICDRATQFAVEDRYQSAREMAQDLDTYLLHARVAETDDHLPMAVRLSTWLRPLAASRAGSVVEGTKVEGAAVTYLDDGIGEILGDAGDATMRSMAATALDEGPPVPETGGTPNASSDDGADEGADEGSEEKPPVFARRALAAVALLSLGAVGYLALSSSPATTAAVPDAMVLATPTDAADAATDATGGFADAAQPEASAPDASAPDAATEAPSPTRRKSDAGPSGGLAELRVSSTPWATVTVRGRSESCDETPCRLRLPAGRYQLELANPVAGLKKVIQVTLRADEPTIVREILQPAPR